MKRLSWEKHWLESKDFSIQRIIFNISILVFLRFLRFPGKISKYVHGNLRESTLVNTADKEELRNPLVAIFYTSPQLLPHVFLRYRQQKIDSPRFRLTPLTFKKFPISTFNT